MNWVERRHECNARHALQDLRAEARGNIEIRTRQLHAESSPAGPIPVLEGAEVGGDFFAVTRNGSTVKFKMTDRQTIRVNGDGPHFNIHVGLDNDGECVLIVAGKPTEPWQVLYKALDELLF